jgi:hypothetical protein
MVVGRQNKMSPPDNTQRLAEIVREAGTDENLARV